MRNAYDFTIFYRRFSKFAAVIANYSDTVCAPATSVGTGAVSVIRISGPESLRIVDKVVRFSSGSASESRGYVLKYGEIPGVDEVVAGIYRAPHSYTGEDSVELCCHASAYIAGRILELLCDSGCRLAEAGEFTRRAFVNGKMDLAQAEAVADVIASSSEAQHRVALNQLRGGYSAELGKIRAELLELTSLMELELDFSEEELEFADRGRLETLLDDAIAHCSSLADSFRLGNAIRNGVPVAIVGAPNSGKSTLLNALLHDERAIVSDVPGTTRDTVEETCVIGGVLFRFIDTAGIRETSDKVELLGIERSFSKAAGAEVVLGVVDAADSPAPENPADDSSVSGQIRKLVGMVDPGRQKLVLLMNKCDKITGVDGATATGTQSATLQDESDTAGFYTSAEELPGTTPEASSAARCDGADFSGLGSSSTREFSGGTEPNKDVTTINNFVKSLISENDAPEVLWISAKRGFGLEKLRELLASMVGKASADGVLVTNARHAAALRDAAASLRAVRSGLGTLPTDLLAEDLRSALASLGSITGIIGTEEVLGEIFSRFCVGK